MHISAQQISDLLSRGNLPQADTLCRIALQSSPREPSLYYFLGVIATRLGLTENAIQYFQNAAQLTQDWPFPTPPPEQMSKQLSEAPKEPVKMVSPLKLDSKRRGALLIKAWGCGFWSDVDHALGQLLLAELTNRIPVVYWGTNSLFGSSTEANAFEYFFEPVSEASIDDLIDDDYSYFPPKWNSENIKKENINKTSGEWSRMDAIYFLNRSESVLVSDFTTQICRLRNWIPSSHHLSGLSVNQLYRAIIEKFLRPRKFITEMAEQFISANMPDAPFISVHMRGSDKTFEVRDMNDRYRQHFEIIDQLLAERPEHSIFALTDDVHILHSLRDRYGARLVSTDCERASGSVGVHRLSNTEDGRKRGLEVMLDTYIALHGEIFIGAGHTNVSAMIRHLKEWNRGDIFLIGPDTHNKYNFVLHNR